MSGGANADPLAFIRRLAGAWDCCGTCAGGVLAAHDAAIRAEALRPLRETLAAWEAERDGPTTAGSNHFAGMVVAALRAAQPTEGES